MSKVDFHEWFNRFEAVLIGVFEEAIEAGPEKAQKAVMAFKLMDQRSLGHRLSRIQLEAADVAREVAPLDPAVR